MRVEGLGEVPKKVTSSEKMFLCHAREAVLDDLADAAVVAAQVPEASAAQFRA